MVSKENLALIESITSSPKKSPPTPSDDTSKAVRIPSGATLATPLDLLKMYFGDDYVVNEKIIIRQPTIGEIVDYGEQDYFSMAHLISSISSDFKPELSDMKLDYEKISDIEMLYIATRHLTVDKTRILFKELDFTRLKMFEQPNSTLLLYDADRDVRIDFHIYAKMMQYVTKLHGIKKKPEFAANHGTKEFLIDLDRQKKKRQAKKPFESILLPLISAMVCSAGFKYTKNEVRNMNMFEFFDAVQRIGVIQSSQALLQGGYSGMADLSKVPKESFNWCRDIYAKK